MIEISKKIFYSLWIGVILIMILLYLQNPEIITPNYIVEFISSYNNEIMLVYILISMVRGLFLIPSTPFVIVGGILFPDKLLLVLFLSMLGVMFSAVLLYYFSDILSFSNYFEKTNSKITKTWKARLQSKKSTYYVLAWSFLPIVPTDLICYLAGIVKMPFKNMLFGVFFGELILDIFYIYFGNSLFYSFL
ncbi:TVP38/TMEM64 family protein [Tenacibaculum amylolyticum]|uniref:TVP38/TMEM64 family protein n=1 Tax=Tenacibaculum amylolyticum TaxID=104269 RepID=UPI00389325D8